MAKKQSFGDKTAGKKNVKDMIKVVRTFKSDQSDSLRFNAEMLRVPDGKSADAFVKELLSK
jgi:hypothetical protein